MEQTQITPELYEQIKAEVLAEIKATNRARAKAREAERIAAMNMFATTVRKYWTLLYTKYVGRVAPNVRVEDTVEYKLQKAKYAALRSVGEFSEVDAYRHGKAEEANKALSEILNAMVNGGNAEQH